MNINLDFLKDDKIATCLFYLSNVKAGGETAFPVAGVATRPVKGSAVFWYNLKKNGQLDTSTWHGACPVVYGVKWGESYDNRFGMEVWIKPYCVSHFSNSCQQVDYVQPKFC